MSFLDEFFNQSVSNAATTMSSISSNTNFQTDTSSVTGLTSLNLLESYTVSVEYYNRLRRENEFLTNAINTSKTDLFTNNRKSYYENQYIADTMKSFKFWVFVYLTLYVIYVYLLFTNNMNESFFPLLAECIILLLYPFNCYFLSEMIVSLLIYISKQPLLTIIAPANTEMGIKNSASTFLT